MSIYLSLDGKNYKLPDALILGRGEPFDTNDRTFARAHARLVHKKDKWKIKDLYSDCGIMVNGNKIQPGKFHSIGPGDKVLLGNVPLELFETMAVGKYTEVQNFVTNDLNDYAPIIYSVMFIMAVVVAVLESTGNYTDDLLFLGAVAVFLKIASVVTRALKTVYFPVKVVLETNMTYEGVTFHLADENNFSLKFDDVKKWYMIGKCFFINVYGKNLIFLLGDGHVELHSLLREHCHKKRAMAEPVIEKVALLPGVFVFIAWIGLSMADSRFFHFVGHGFGILGLLGLLGLFFSEHLRELLPIPSSVSPKVQTLGLATIIAFTMVMQFSQMKNHVESTKLRSALTSCFHEKGCTGINFTLLQSKKLQGEEANLLARICREGNITACPGDHKRKPASK